MLLDVQIIELPADRPRLAVEVVVLPSMSACTPSISYSASCGSTLRAALVREKTGDGLGR